MPDLTLWLPEVRPTPALSPEQEKRRLFVALTSFLLDQADQRTLVRSIEDLHWSDDTSLEFLLFLTRHLFRWEQEHLPQVTGYVGGYVLEPAVRALSILVIVVFDSQAAYSRHRDDPEQGHWEQHLQELLEQAPQWHEGEITELFAEAHGL